jgi:plasmid stabilization system protein ParE
MHSISFRPEAREGYLAARRWYDEQVVGLGADFEACIEQKLLSIREHPKSFSVVHRDIREAVGRRFPYAIYFRLNERGIRVLSVFHTSRNPAHWQSRTDD